MATQFIEDPESKEQIPFEWDNPEPPTPDDIQSLFSAVRKGTSPKSVPQLMWQGVKNIPKSGWDVLSGTLGIATHPFRTAEAIGGYAGKIGRAGIEQLLGEEVDPEAEAAVKSYAEPIKKSIENPLGVPRRMLEWGSEHPVEAGLTVAGGLQSLGLKTAAKYANPFTLPGMAVEKTVSKIAGKVPPFEEVVTTGIEKGVKPSTIGKGTFGQSEKYMERASDAVRTIIQNKDNLSLTDDMGNVVKGQLPQNLKQFSQAIEQSKQSIFDKYDALTREAGEKGATVKLTPITKELNTIVSNAPANDLNRSVVAYARKLGDTLAERGIYTVRETQDAIAMLNNRLEAFYKNPSYEAASKAYVDALVANNLRKSLDTVINSVTGERYQPLKNQYGSLRAIEKDVTKRSIVEGRRAPKQLIDFSDVFTGYHVVRGLITLNPSTIGAGAAAKYLAWLYRNWNNPNKIVRKMFQRGERAIAKEPPFTPYSGPPGREIPRFPESKYMMAEPTEPTTTPNLPTPYITGVPAVSGKLTDIPRTFIRQAPPQLEWWKGPGAKGVEPLSTPPASNILPPGIGFTLSKGVGKESYSSIPPGKRHAEFLSRQREKWHGTPSVTEQELQTEISMAKDALFRGVPRKKVLDIFKARTGIEYPE